MQLGIRAPMFGMRPDSTLVLVTPADLVVNTGMGTAIIAAADTGVQLVVTSLDTLTTPHVTARGHVVRFTRPDSSRLVSLTAVADSLTPREDRK